MTFHTAAIDKREQEATQLSNARTSINKVLVSMSITSQVNSNEMHVADLSEGLALTYATAQATHSQNGRL